MTLPLEIIFLGGCRFCNLLFVVVFTLILLDFTK